MEWIAYFIKKLSLLFNYLSQLIGESWLFYNYYFTTCIHNLLLILLCLFCSNVFLVSCFVYVGLKASIQFEEYSKVILAWFR